MSSNDRIKISFTRQEFYDKLWSIPTSKLAAELGCSDATIGKVCKAFRIPKPYVGYWAKLNNGKKPKRTKLPKDESADKEKLTFYKYLTAKPNENAIPIEAQFDPDIIELLSLAKSLGPVIVPDSCVKLHPLVRQWRTEIAKRKDSEKLPWDQRACVEYEPTLAIHVSSEQIDRASRIMDALIRRTEAVGGCFEVVEGTRHYSEATTCVILAGVCATSIRLRERTNMVRVKATGPISFLNHDRTENIFNGLLLFDRGPSDFHNWMPKETPTKPIEGMLTGFVLKIIHHIGEARIKEREREAARRTKEEADRLAREKALEIQHRKEDLFRQKSAE